MLVGETFRKKNQQKNANPKAYHCLYLACSLVSAYLNFKANISLFRVYLLNRRQLLGSSCTSAPSSFSHLLLLLHPVRRTPCKC